MAGKMDEGQLESSSEEGSSLDEPSWVSWFCMLRNHEFFCEVDPAFVQDRFNLYGLKEVVGPLYGEAMTMILGYAPTGPLPRAPPTHVGRSSVPAAACQPATSARPPGLLLSPRGRRGLLGEICLGDGARDRVGADADHLTFCRRARLPPSRPQRSNSPTRRSESIRCLRLRACSTGSSTHGTS